MLSYPLRIISLLQPWRPLPGSEHTHLQLLNQRPRHELGLKVALADVMAKWHWQKELPLKHQRAFVLLVTIIGTGLKLSGLIQRELQGLVIVCAP